MSERARFSHHTARKTYISLIFSSPRAPPLWSVISDKEGEIRLYMNPLYVGDEETLIFSYGQYKNMIATALCDGFFHLPSFTSARCINDSFSGVRRVSEIGYAASVNPAVSHIDHSMWLYESTKVRECIRLTLLATHRGISEWARALFLYAKTCKALRPHAAIFHILYWPLRFGRQQLA